MLCRCDIADKTKLVLVKRHLNTAIILYCSEILGVSHYSLSAGSSEDFFCGRTASHYTQKKHYPEWSSQCITMVNSFLYMQVRYNTCGISLIKKSKTALESQPIRVNLLQHSQRSGQQCNSNRYGSRLGRCKVVRMLTCRCNQ